MAVTHQDIADKLGISRTIVTQALHGTRSSRVSAQTQREVIETSRRLGYRPRNRTTHNIGFVTSVGSLLGETDSTFITHVEKALRHRGYRLVLVGIDSDPHQDFSEVLNSKTVDGVMIAHWHGGRVLDSLPSDLPFVVVTNEDGVGENVDLFAVDPITTMGSIVEYLIGFGHRRLALMTADADIKFYRLIVQGVRKAVAAASERGVTLQVVNNEIKYIPEQVATLMSQSAAPTALIIDDLWRATPVIYALRDQGYRIPADVSVISYADSHQFTTLRPALTVTDQFRPELAEKAVERLLQKIQTPETIPTQTLIAGKVVERESVAPPSTRKN